MYYQGFEWVDFITSAVNSYGAIYGKAQYLYEGQIIERYYLNLTPYDFDSEKLLQFVV